MTTQVRIKTRKGEGGNVLFLILIAVALFAALSYAVTQSTRSGGGDASKEKSLVSSATVTQYPASVKTAIVRMMISNGVSVDSLLFDKPPYTNLTTDALKKAAVFYPDPGGGATYSTASADVGTTGAPLPWYFNGENEVKNIGTNPASGSVPTASSADVIAFLPDITKAVCDKVHEQLGMAKTYATLAANITDTNQADPGIDFGGVIITSAVLDGQPQGCFLLSTGPDRYVYYHVLVER